MIKLDQIPKSPGCYIFKNKHGEVIYIGKSKMLYDRVRQYFNPAKNDDYDKYVRLSAEVSQTETAVTGTETDVTGG